jgi:arabinogalactan endo-1,4-beta-galactosidase
MASNCLYHESLHILLVIANNPEDEGEAHKSGFVNFKHAVIHECVETRIKAVGLKCLHEYICLDWHADMSGQDV